MRMAFWGLVFWITGLSSSGYSLGQSETQCPEIKAQLQQLLVAQKTVLNLMVVKNDFLSHAMRSTAKEVSDLKPLAEEPIVSKLLNWAAVFEKNKQREMKIVSDFEKQSAKLIAATLDCLK